MIELKHDRLLFAFPDVHEDAKLSIDFQRTLRIPDDEKTYRLPPGLGSFPMRHVDDHAKKVPASWLERGGVMLPMFQSEALWICFRGRHAGYPFAIKIATGKINAVTGDEWRNNLREDPQDYVVVPDQPWLDGYCVEKGLIRQFVAMPLGSGYTAEEQLTGEAEHGGLQLIVYPMKADVYEELRDRRRTLESDMLSTQLGDFAPTEFLESIGSMGLAPGGRMKQEIYDDPHGLDAWETEHSSRCFVHMANSLVWQSITGSRPPHPPPTASAYTEAGLPWFDYYNEARALSGAEKLAKLHSVSEMGVKKNDEPLPENTPVTPKTSSSCGGSSSSTRTRSERVGSRPMEGDR